VSLVVWPTDLGEAARRLEDLGAWGLGANCQDGMVPATTLARELRRVTSLPLILKPAGGLPGTPLASPSSFAAAAACLSELEPVLVGGCCGTTEAHVAALRVAWYHAEPGRRSE
jgi:methionine synthase I (cobalamin-dependent)